MDRRAFLSLLAVSPVLAAPFDEFKKGMGQEFKKFQKELTEEFEAYKTILKEEFSSYKRSLSKSWDEPAISSNYTWVQYSKDFQTRSIVDFLNNTLTIESLGTDQQSAVQNNQQHLEHLFRQDTKSAVSNDGLISNIEQRLGDFKHVLKGSIPAGDSILGMAYEGEVLGDSKFPGDGYYHTANNPYKQMGYHLIKTKSPDTRTLEENVLARAQHDSTMQASSGKTAYSAVIKLPSRFLKKRAKQQVPFVLERSNKYRVNFPTLMSVMHTESTFNPMALADSEYGLMLINPETSGREAHKKIYGNEKIITPTFLYNNINNIEFGSAYFYLLYHEHFKGVSNPESRLYCSIAAYNAGLGNVARSFTGRPVLKKSYDAINALQPDAVLKTLQDKLPYEESKIYITKVKERTAYYSN